MNIVTFAVASGLISEGNDYTVEPVLSDLPMYERIWSISRGRDHTI